MHNRFWAAAIVAAACTAQAQVAAPDRFSGVFDECVQKADGRDTDMANCAWAEGERQDQRLNQAYKSLMAMLPAERKKRMQEAQRAWVQYKEKQLVLESSATGGTMDRVNAASLYLSMTAERADYLEREIENWQGR